MLANYQINHHGVISQIERKTYIYDQNYIEHSFNRYGVLGEKMSFLRFGFLLGVMGHIPTSIMDVGYGNGNFLRVAHDLVKDCSGFDIEPAYPLPPSISSQTSLYSRSYDVVTFFDSLEHFPNIYEIAAMQAEWVIITVPWCHARSQGDEWFDGWKHRKPDEHLWHFDPESMTEFMRSLGYQAMKLCALEDTIRGGGPHNLPNILTGGFRKI